MSDKNTSVNCPGITPYVILIQIASPNMAVTLSNITIDLLTPGNYCIVVFSEDSLQYGDSIAMYSVDYIVNNNRSNEIVWIVVSCKLSYFMETIFIL